MVDVASDQAFGGLEREGTLSRVFGVLGLGLFYAVLLVSWELLVDIFDVPGYLLPAPVAIARSLVTDLLWGDMLYSIRVTMVEIFAGFALGTIVGVTFGLLIAEFKFVDRAIFPLIVVIQCMPKIALAPLIVIWVGFGIETKIITAAIVAVFPIMVATVTGMRAYDRDMLELFSSMSANRAQTFWHLKLPVAVPFLLAGLEVGFVHSTLGAIVGEFVSGSAGLGVAILQLQYQADTAGAFAHLVVLGALGASAHWVFAILRRYFVFWQVGTTR